MTDLGVEVLHLRDDEDVYEKGEEILFQGFGVTEETTTETTTLEDIQVSTFLSYLRFMRNSTCSHTGHTPILRKEENQARMTTTTTTASLFRTKKQAS